VEPGLHRLLRMSLYADATLFSEDSELESRTDRSTIGDKPALHVGRSSRCGRRCSRRRAVLCVAIGTLVILGAYVGSAAVAVAALARGTTATINIRSVGAACGSSVLVTADLRTMNPSSWAVSLHVAEMYVRDLNDTLTSRVDSAGFTPSTIHLPAGASVTVPLTASVDLVNVPAVGAMLHETYTTGRVHMKIGLSYAGRLDMFPFTVEGTMALLVKTATPAGDPPPHASAESDRKAPAPPGMGGASGARAQGTTDTTRVKTIDTLHLGMNVLAATRPIVDDSAAGLTISTTLTVSASWIICLICHIFKDIPTIVMRLSSVGVDRHAVASVRMVTFRLSDDYNTMSWGNSEVEILLEASVGVDQAADARTVLTKLATGTAEVSLHANVVPGDCPILQAVATMVGEYSFMVSGLLSSMDNASVVNVRRPSIDNPQAVVGGDHRGGIEVTFGHEFMQNATATGMLDWIGLVVSHNATALSARPDTADTTSLRGRIVYRTGSFIEALVRAQPWDQLNVAVPLRRCAEAEQACSLDADCLAIVTSVLDIQRPTAAETLHCARNQRCAWSLAQCASRPGDPVPVGVATRFDVSTPRRVSQDTDSVLITATYPQSQLTGLVQSLVDEILPALAGDQSQMMAFDMWQLSLLANADPPTVLGKALGFRLNVVTPSDLDRIIASSAIFQREETDVEAEAMVEEEEVVDEIEGTRAPGSGSPCGEPVPPPTLELLPRRPGDSDQTLRMQAAMPRPQTGPFAQRLVYLDNKIALKYFFDGTGGHWGGWDVSVPPAHTDAQRMFMIEFEGAMVIAEMWTFNITLFNGPSLEHFGTQAFQYTRHDASMALGLDVSLDDGAIVTPLDLVFRQLPQVCSGQPSSPAPSPPADERLDVQSGGANPPSCCCCCCCCRRRRRRRRR
jgi:hypothetical protein